MTPAGGDGVPDGVVPALAPLPMRTAGERIAERIVTAIGLGQFVPGQRLPSERELATLLAVSRGSVREALQRLAADGHVTIKRGATGGAFVTDTWTGKSEEMVRATLLPQWQRLEQALDLRNLFEQQVARTAAERRTNDDVRAIEAALRMYESAGEDRAAGQAADRTFHAAIAAATHNGRLVELQEQLRSETTLGFRGEPFSPAVRARALEQHPRLARAVIEGDAEGAVARAAEHFRLAGDAWRLLHEHATDELRPPAPTRPSDEFR